MGHESRTSEQERMKIQVGKDASGGVNLTATDAQGNSQVIPLDTTNLILATQTHLVLVKDAGGVPGMLPVPLITLASTRLGSILGTLGQISPESLSSKELGGEEMLNYQRALAEVISTTMQNLQIVLHRECQLAVQEGIRKMQEERAAEIRTPKIVLPGDLTPGILKKLRNGGGGN